MVHAAGCRVIHSVRQEPRALRHTPRWERWGPDINGYSAYRRALDYERQGNSGDALREYDLALRYEPANFLINVGKAALLEVEGRFEDASEVYRTCNELWPEHVETAYRLSASYANYGEYGAAESALDSIKLRLRRWSLRKEETKTRYLTRWNVGERRYWRSWSRKHPPILGSRKSSNRHHLLQAVQVAEQVREIGRIVCSGQTRKVAENGQPVEVSVDYLIAKMAKLTTQWAPDSPCKNLFHPELLVSAGQLTAGQPSSPAPAIHPKVKSSLIMQLNCGNTLKTSESSHLLGAGLITRFRRSSVVHGQDRDESRPAAQPTKHDHLWHIKLDDDNLVIHPQVLARSPWLLRPKKQMGWLAHYNAACFFSLALNVDRDLLPTGYTIDEWQIDCARAAIRELGYVRRDPLSRVEADWYRRDPELKPLTSYVNGTRWAKLVGL